MYSFVLQDWINVAANQSVVQSECGWLDLEPFRDVVLWFDFRGGSFSSDQLVLACETSPTKDEDMFDECARATWLLGTAPPLVVASVILSTNPDVPLARWIRWRLHAAGLSNTDATFRIFGVANTP